MGGYMTIRLAVRILGICLLLVTSNAFCLRVLDLPRTPALPTIDGRVTPQEMANAAVTSMTLFGSLDRPKNATEVAAALTPGGLYVGFRCKDAAPAGLIGKCTKENGAVFLDDSVEFFLAAAQDATKTNYFHFSLNCLGTAYSNSMDSDRPVPDWKHAVQKTADGWEAEMLIPLPSIRAATGLPHWRANMSRYRPARGAEPEEKSVWVDPGTTMHNYRRFGYLKMSDSHQPIPVADMPTVPRPMLSTTNGTGATSSTAAPAGK